MVAVPNRGARETMGITASLSVSVLGEGTSVSDYVKAAVAALKQQGVKHQVGPMSTAIEARDLDGLFGAAKAAHDAVVKAGAKRIVMTLHVDSRLDKSMTLEQKVAEVKGR